MREIKLSSIQISEKPLLRGELFWCRPSGRKLRIGHAGEFVDSELIQKLAKTNDQFIQEILINEERVSQVVNHFLELKNAQLEDVRLRYRNLILVDLYRVLKGEQESSTLDFLFICYETFNDLGANGLNIEDSFIRTNAMTLKSAQVVACVVIYTALISGYTDFSFLKEVYNTIILTYYSYVKRYENALESYKKSDRELVNYEYLKSLSSGFFELNYSLSDDISSLWFQVHKNVFELDVNFNETDLENIFKTTLETIKDYRYLDSIMVQEGSL